MSKELKLKIMEYAREKGYDIDGDIVIYKGKIYYVNCSTHVVKECGNSCQ